VFTRGTPSTVSCQKNVTQEVRTSQKNNPKIALFAFEEKNASCPRSVSKPINLMQKNGEKVKCYQCEGTCSDDHARRAAASAAATPPPRRTPYPSRTVRNITHSTTVHTPTSQRSFRRSMLQVQCIYGFKTAGSNDESCINIYVSEY